MIPRSVRRFLVAMLFDVLIPVRPALVAIRDKAKAREPAGGA